MPRRVELDLALAGLALARNWLVGEPERVRRILDEVGRLASARPDDWFDVPERDLLYRREEVELWVERVAVDGEVVAAALEGLPAVIVWHLAGDAV